MVTDPARSATQGLRKKWASALAIVLLMSGCSREQQDWRAAETADSIESYSRFIQHHPESELTTQARTRIAQLGEDHDWQHAGSADSADAYRQFLEQHPNGKWAQEARIRMENFSLGAQPAGAAGAGAGAHAAGGGSAGAAMMQDAPAVSAPAGAPASSGTSALSGASAASSGAPAASSAFGIQLGAFSSEASATTQWQTLSARFGPELKGLQERVVPAATASGRIYRLQAVVGDEARARAICESLRRQSQGCVAVLPH
jgi:cell division septation protein DedD